MKLLYIVMLDIEAKRHGAESQVVCTQCAVLLNLTDGERSVLQEGR